MCLVVSFDQTPINGRREDSSELFEYSPHVAGRDHLQRSRYRKFFVVPDVEKTTGGSLQGFIVYISTNCHQNRVDLLGVLNKTGKSSTTSRDDVKYLTLNAIASLNIDSIPM